MEQSEDNFVCRLCPNYCRLQSGNRGRCLGRGIENGVPILFNYGKVVASHVDPIEKKPLYHFYPGRQILSIGTFGCNLSCQFCQNFQLSQRENPSQQVSPEQLAEWGSGDPDNLGVAFTYNEPGIWFEYIVDAAPLLQEKGLKVVLVTNGYLEPDPWKRLCGLVDAMNIDLKSFQNSFYERLCHGKLAPVLKNIQTAVEAGVHVEVTNLVVTQQNDNPAEFSEMISWLAELSSGLSALPLHLSRYFPQFRETAPATSPETLNAFFCQAKKILPYVFLGNISSEAGQHSICPDCGRLWVERSGYQTRVAWPKAVCSCGKNIPVIGICGSGDQA